jgi:hypothetical protein
MSLRWSHVGLAADANIHCKVPCVGVVDISSALSTSRRRCRHLVGVFDISSALSTSRRRCRHLVGVVDISSALSTSRRRCWHLVGALLAEVVNPVISCDRSAASEIFSYWLRLACMIIVRIICGITEIFGSGSRKILTLEYSRSKESELLPIFHIIKRKMLWSGSGSKIFVWLKIFESRPIFPDLHVLCVRPLTCVGAPCRTGAARQQKFQQLGSRAVSESLVLVGLDTPSESKI